MPAELIDGKQIALDIRTRLKKEIEKLDEKPGLAVVIVGTDPASTVYVRMKHKACNDLGINSYMHHLPEETTQEQLLELIDVMNGDPKVNGILVQLPLPSQINENVIINEIDPAKDVDGFHPVNTGKMLNGEKNCFLPCTPLGCQELIYRTVKELKGKHLVVVGRSNIVGKPIAAMMLQKSDRANCIVTVCHSASPDISKYTRQADILVAAMGRPEFISEDMVKDGVVVIDVGVNRVEDSTDPRGYRLVGDVQYDSIKEKASAITPVPGGVGPMTIAMLMQNTYKAFLQQRS